MFCWLKTLLMRGDRDRGRLLEQSEAPESASPAQSASDEAAKAETAEPSASEDAPDSKRPRMSLPAFHRQVYEVHSYLFRSNADLAHSTRWFQKEAEEKRIAQEERAEKPEANDPSTASSES